MKKNKIHIYLKLIYSIIGMVLIFFGIYNLSTKNKYAEAASHKPIWAGYTSATSTGNLGDISGANARCNSAYPGSHWGTLEEIIELGPNYPWTYDVWIGNINSGPMILGSRYLVGFDSYASGEREYLPYPHVTTCSGWTSGNLTISLANTVNGYNASQMWKDDYANQNFYYLNYQYGPVLRAAGYPDWDVCSVGYRLACVK
jgi:hypothetical protein